MSYLKVVINRLRTFCFIILSLVFQQASPNLLPSNIDVQEVSNSSEPFNIIHQDNTLLIQGTPVNGNLKIYSIIGNIIVDMNIQDFSKVVIPINLERQNLYIIRIETTDNTIFTQKIVAY